jgi:hypothetical protein
VVANPAIQPKTESGEREYVILIHGTGAGHSSWRSGPQENNSWLRPKWWQPTSDFSRKLEGALKPRVRIVPPFRWDPHNGGGNSERARQSAGNRLLIRLRRLESRGLAYHLVGHSHGGSVIWHALEASFLDGQGPLNNLKTWTTVGTPFFTWRADPMRWWWIFPALIFVFAFIFETPTLIDVWLERPRLFESADLEEQMAGLGPPR